MASEQLFLVALMFLIVGNGCFKPNISTQVGGLYAPGDPRRDRAFSVFYMGINLGAFIAPLICGTLGQVVGWHYGFGAAGVGMVLGLVIYLTNQDKLPLDPPPTTSPTAPVAATAAFVARRAGRHRRAALAADAADDRSARRWPCSSSARASPGCCACRTRIGPG